MKPHVEVRKDPPKMLRGEDPQLEAAIDLMLAAIEDAPPAMPQRPPGPDRSGMGVPVGER